MNSIICLSSGAIENLNFFFLVIYLTIIIYDFLFSHLKIHFIPLPQSLRWFSVIRWCFVKEASNSLFGTLWKGTCVVFCNPCLFFNGSHCCYMIKKLTELWSISKNSCVQITNFSKWDLWKINSSQLANISHPYSPLPLPAKSKWAAFNKLDIDNKRKIIMKNLTSLHH